jgi:hypothetical protein
LTRGFRIGSFYHMEAPPTASPLTVRMVAERLGWTMSKVRREIIAGRLVPEHRIPGPNGVQLFNPADVEALATAEAADLKQKLAHLQPVPASEEAAG